MDELLLLSKNDIPFVEGCLVLHNPTIKEIAFLGEQDFYIGCNFLNFSKEKFLNDEDKIHLTNQSNFDILMSIIINGAEKQIKLICQKALMVLALLFPNYKIDFTPKAIIFTSSENNEDKGYINNNNFEQFKILLNKLFNLEINEKDEQKLNPQNETAKRIAEKLNRGRQQVNKLKNGSNFTSILSRYISILSVGEKKDMNSFFQYTIYQLFNEFQRFELKENFDMYVKAKMAGAKDIKEVDNWMKDFNS